MRVLGATTSFMDTCGAHHDLLKEKGFDVVAARFSMSGFLGHLNQSERNLLNALRHNRE